METIGFGGVNPMVGEEYEMERCMGEVLSEIQVVAHDCMRALCNGWWVQQSWVVEMNEGRGIM